MRYCIFAYDFPHRKTNAFIRAMARIIDDDILIIAAPFVDIPHGTPLIQWEEKPNNAHPRDVARQLDLSYLVSRHEECFHILDTEKPDIGVVAGARIIPDAVIKRFPYGILNLHNGILPLNRGLDCMKWAVYNGLPQGVTAHIINERVDAGLYLDHTVIDVWPRDGFGDIAERLFVAERSLLKHAVHIMNDNADRVTHLTELTGGSTHGRMTTEQEATTLRRFEQYKIHYPDIREEW